MHADSPRSTEFRASIYSCTCEEQRGTQSKSANINETQTTLTDPIRSESSLKDTEHRAEHRLEHFSAISRPMGLIISCGPCYALECFTRSNNTTASSLMCLMCLPGANVPCSFLETTYSAAKASIKPTTAIFLGWDPSAMWHNFRWRATPTKGHIVGDTL